MDKFCFSCKKRKSLNDFNSNKSKDDGLQTKCRSCQKEYDKEYYKNNEKRRKQILEKNNRQIIKAQKFIVEYLLIHPCIDYGESNIIVLEFDHRENKIFNFSDKITHGASIKILEKEVLKCDIRCANCHRIKTSKDFNFWKYKFLEEMHNN